MTPRRVSRVITKKFWKTTQLAALLGVSPVTIINWIKRGKIKAIRIHSTGIYLIPDDEVQRLLKGKGSGEGGEP